MIEKYYRPEYRFEIIKSNLEIYSLNLADTSLPLWSPHKKSGQGIWGDCWASISDNLKKSDGFILVKSIAFIYFFQLFQAEISLIFFTQIELLLLPKS